MLIFRLKKIKYHGYFLKSELFTLVKIIKHREKLVLYNQKHKKINFKGIVVIW